MTETTIKFTHRNCTGQLLLGDGKEKLVLARMSLFEGTGKWVLTDLRMRSFHRVPSEFSCVLGSDMVNSWLAFESEEELNQIKNHLREYTVDYEANMIHWATYQGVVRGQPVTRDKHQYLANHLNHIGFFSRKEGLAYLKEAQRWWAEYEGKVEDAALPNPHIQPSSFDIKRFIAYPSLFNSDVLNTERVIE